MAGGEHLGDGFTRLPNRLGEALVAADFTATQFKIVLCMLRLTVAWHRRTVRLSQAELAKKCGVNPKSGGFRVPFERLLENGVIVELIPRSGRRPPAYELNTDFTTWGTYRVDLESLKSRFRGRPQSVDHCIPERPPFASSTKDSDQREAVEPETRDRRLTFEGHSTRNEISPRVTSQGHSTNQMVSQDGTQRSLGRNLQVPLEAPIERPKSLAGNDIAPPKESESKEKKKAAKEKTVAAAADVEHRAYETLIIGVAVDAVKERWPTHTLITRGGRALVVAYMTAGVPKEAAAEAIRRATKRAISAPGSIAWYKSAVIEFWHENRLKLDIGMPATPSLAGSTPKPLPAESTTTRPDPGLYRRRAEYEAARYENAIAWQKDPANSDSYQAIVRRFTAPHSREMLELSWVTKGVNRDIMDACISAASFPDFEAWLAERTAAERAPTR